MNPLDAKHLDGPKVVEWLEERNLLKPTREAAVGKNLAYRLRHWEKGAAAEVYAVDRLMCRVGRALGELPDDFYREPPAHWKGGIKRAMSDEKVELIHALAADESLTYTQIGDRVGCNRRTVAKYLKAVA